MANRIERILYMVSVGVLILFYFNWGRDIYELHQRNDEDLRVLISGRQQIRQRYRMQGIDPGPWPDDYITKRARELGLVESGGR